MKSVLSFLGIALLFSAVSLAQTSSSPYSTSPTTATMNQITNGPVAETVSDSSAFIGWSSKEAASGSSIKYGTARDHMNEKAEATDNTDGKNHHARLTNLSPDTTYYFQVMANGQPQGGIGTFRTVGPGDKPIQSKAVISQK